MNIIGTFDPTTATSGTFVAAASSASGKLVIYNESNVGVKLMFTNGYVKYLAAWTADIVCGNLGPLNINWEQIQTLQSNNPPLSYILFESYDSGEAVPGTFPTALSRQSNIGNPVSTVGGIASSIVNDGNVATTQIIEATVGAEGFSSVTLTNDGTMELGSSSSPSRGVLTIHNGINANLITALSGNDMARHVATGQRTVDTVNGVDISQSTLTGFKVLSGTLSVPFGLGLKGITWFGPLSATTVQQTFNHNLGVTPNVVLTVIDGTSSTSAIVKVDYTTLGVNTFKATGSVNVTFYGIALAFA